MSKKISASMLGKKCIVRTSEAGVWFGEIKEKSGREVVIQNARRLWWWKAAKSLSLSAVAVYGVVSDDCRLAPAVPQVWLEAIEIIPASIAAIDSIEGTPDAVQS